VRPRFPRAILAQFLHVDRFEKFANGFRADLGREAVVAELVLGLENIPLRSRADAP